METEAEWRARRARLPTITATVPHIPGWVRIAALSCGHTRSVYADDGWRVGDHYDCPECAQARVNQP